MSNNVRVISIKGDICEKVRSYMVQIIRQHNLNNNLNYNVLSNQTPQKEESVGSYRVKVFEISQPRVDNASTTKALTDAKRTMITGAKVEVFPERLIGALVDLYILYFALTKTKIPKRDDKYQSVLSGIEQDYIDEQITQNNNAFSFLNDNLEKNKNTNPEVKGTITKETDTNTEVENTNAEDENRIAEGEKTNTKDEDANAKEKDAITEDKKIADYSLNNKMIPYIASAWFCDLLRKKEYTKNLYQKKFEEIEAQNKKKLKKEYRDFFNNPLSNDKKEEIDDDKLNAKIFVLAQIKHINTSAFNTYNPHNIISKKKGGIRKTKKNKNSKKRRNNKTTRRKRNTKRNKR